MDTLRFVREAFAGQTDRQGNTISSHCTRVMIYANRMRVSDWRAALLHDILEDCPLLPADLIKLGYRRGTVEIVQDLTNDLGSSPRDYARYVKRICECDFDDAILIKFADLCDNTDPARHAGVRKDFIERQAKKREGTEEALRKAWFDRAGDYLPSFEELRR